MPEVRIKALLSRMRSGEDGAFEELYHSLKTPVYTVIYRITGTKESAEDVLQEVFISLFRSPPGADVKNPRAWIFRMACNRAIDFLRAARPQEETDDMQSPSYEEASCQRLDIEAALASLPLHERSIAVMHLTAGLTYREIASVTGKSISDIYRTYRKAVSKLQKKLNGE